jgi:hypothetical protein
MNSKAFDLTLNADDWQRPGIMFARECVSFSRDYCLLEDLHVKNLAVSPLGKCFTDGKGLDLSVTYDEAA